MSSLYALLGRGRRRLVYHHDPNPTNQSKVHIVVSKFGKVEQIRIDSVIDVMQECYTRLRPHDVGLVDLYLFERSSSVEAFLSKECNEVGVVSTPFDESFFAMHDAWRGTPRIILCFERMKKLPKLVHVGGIRHEVGHSVLHGSLEYYLLPLPRTLVEVANRFGFSSEYAMNLLYLVSIAVKDYEVSRLLYERGYVEDLMAYAKHVLTASESDILSWKMAQGKPLAEVMCLIASLKAISCAAALLNDETYGEEIKRHLTASISYFPPDRSSLISKMILESFPSFGADTLDNINKVIGKCELIFENLFS